MKVISLVLTYIIITHFTRSRDKVRGGAGAAWVDGAEPDSDDEDTAPADASGATGSKKPLPPTAVADLRSTLLPVRAHAVMSLGDYARDCGAQLSGGQIDQLIGR